LGKKAEPHTVAFCKPPLGTQQSYASNWTPLAERAFLQHACISLQQAILLGAEANRGVKLARIAAKAIIAEARNITVDYIETGARALSW